MEKIGIIDLGSNSARLVIVNLFEDGFFMVVDELKESVRLGQDMERDGFLKPQRVAETVKTLRMFKRLCDVSGVTRIIGVATEAVRRAKNQRSFLDEIQTSCGVKLRVLSAEEEAVLVYRGVINTMDIPKGVILEIGGGSTKIIYYNRRNMLRFATIPFGAVTLTDLFSGEELRPEEQAAKMEEFFLEKLNEVDWLGEIDPDAQMIGVGGSFRNLFKINKMVHKYPLDIVHNFNLQAEDFYPVYDMIKVLDLDKKKKIKGLSAERADILPAAFAIIKTFVQRLNFTNFTFSGSGLREGIMFNQAFPATVDKPILDVMNYSLTTLVKYYGCDERHVEHVVNLSVQLFKQLRVLHKFPRQYLKVLKVAAMLHDCGMRIKYYNHQRHSCYMILNSTLYGVTHREIVLAAFTACCHKKEDINAYNWNCYRDVLQEDDIEIVKRLGVMLRIAESLDRSMAGVVKGINCDILGDSVIMKTEVEGDASLEIRDALAASAEFKKSFRKNLEIL
ncbi:MAG: Ppx/GppA family phosphatase [Clostridia bacterium]|nr:Ppx/GppA family phosphatase [Clostridia bacterium]MDE6790860.1 Ppx/GppA family phosphatase [Clostridia bacterium]MDE7401564.1 Ppx/GppA family phosphatase [Clostridia bacterium]